MTERNGSTNQVILCGLDELGLRTLEELRRLGQEVTVVARRIEEPFATNARELGARLVEGSDRDEAVLLRAGIRTAAAVVIVEDDDIGNLHAALAAQELNPRVRLVLRMFNQEFGQRVQALFTDCRALSSSAIAAPAFVAAALHDQGEHHLTVADRVLVVRRESARDHRVLLPLARLDSSGAVTELFPEPDEGLLCVAYSEMPSAHGASAVSRGAPAVAASLGSFLQADQRLRWLLVALIGLIAVSTVLFELTTELTLLQALYFTVTVITTTGFGDISLLREGPWLLAYGTALMLIGTAVLTLFYAFITDAIVSARIGRISTGIARGLRNHIVVCGLGNVGYRVVEQMVHLDVPVVAAELREQGGFLPAVRRLGVPVLIADVRLPETLRALNVGRARCVVVATDDDLANLETALNARTLSPHVRVVLRLFDPDLATRVERAFHLGTSRSVAGIAAPAFATAAVGERVLATIGAGQTVLVFAQLEVEAGSAAQGRTVGWLEATSEGRVLHLGGAARRMWRPPAATALVPGTELAVVATSTGLARLVELVEAPPLHPQSPAPHRRSPRDAS